MESKSINTNNIKVTDRIHKLCNTARGFSEKDIKALTYIVEKSSRIAAVSFLLADVLDEREELRAELKRSAIGLVRDASLSAHSLQKRDMFTAHLLELVALLDTAQRSGLLSRMNTETLANEITDLSELLTTIDWNTGRRFTEEAFFGGSIPKELFDPEPIRSRSESFERHMKDNHVPRMSVQEHVSGQYSTQAQKDTGENGRVQYKERVQEIQKDRRAAILGLVQKKDRITVKDVANIIKDCSEKTIQRELLALVKQGVLKKEGERRWSTYSLV